MRESLERQEAFLKGALSDGKEGYLRRGKDGRPIVTPPQALPPSPSAIELEKRLSERMPERQLLAAIATPNTGPSGPAILGPRRA